ncbi:MAG: autotransporter-associated beta strand repeat-containing protein, partial [Akkermansia sp.]
TWGGNFTFSGNFTQTVGTTLNIIQSYFSNKITFSGENMQFSNLIVDPELLINTSGSFVANDLKFANGRVTLMTVSGTGNTNINGVLSQGANAGSLVKSNTGTLTLAGVNTYAGGTTINGGKIVVNSKTSGLGTGAVTLSGNDAAANATLELATGSTLTNNLTVTAAKFGTLSGAGTYGALTINGNLSMGADKSVMTLNATSLTTGATSTLNFDVASTTSYDKITLGSGNIALNAGTTFNLAFAAGFASDTEFNLDLMTGTLTGDLAQYAVTGLDTSVWGYTWVYANSKLTLQLINKNPSLTWVGGADARWTLDTTTPWTNGTIATAYKNTTKVVFNDLSGKNAETVTIKGEVAPQSILVSNATTDYTLASDATTAGVIAGSGALTKEGAGSLNILTNNTSTGVMTISAGEVTLGNGTISGAWAGAIVNNSILNLNNTVTTEFGQLLSGSGKMVIKSGTVVLNNNGNSFSGGIDIQGAGTILKYTTGWQDSPSSFFGTGTITMGAGTRMELSPGAGGGIVTHKNALVLNGGTIVAMNRNHVFDNTVSLTGSNTLLGTVADRNMSLTGVISGDGSLYVGSSSDTAAKTRIILTGANTYKGGTTIDHARLLVNTGSLGTGDVILNEGGVLQANSVAVSVGNKLQVKANATLDTGGAEHVFTLSGGITQTADTTLTLAGSGTFQIGSNDVFATTSTISLLTKLTLSSDSTTARTINGNMTMASHGLSLTLGSATQTGKLTFNGILSTGGNTGGFNVLSDVDVHELNLRVQGYNFSTITVADKITFRVATLAGSMGNTEFIQKDGAGTLVIESLKSGLAVNKQISIVEGALEFAPQAQATTIAIDGKITGAGNLVKSGAGTLTLSVANDYAGTTSINGGTLTLTGAGSLGGGNILLAGASAGQAVLNLIAANTIANNVTIGEGKFGTLTGWNTASTGTITLESNATHDGALILGAGQH